METIMAIIAGILVVIGSIFSLLAAVGVVRLPDVYTRMHAASKAGTVGSGLLLITLGLYSFDGATLSRSLAGFIFFLLTAPISAHLLARAAYAAGYPMAEITVLNEMPREDSDPSAAG